MKKTPIYVELLEGTLAFAPVPAIHLGGRFYKILGHNRDDYETLRFNTGSYVFCLLSKFSKNENLVPVAYCEITKEQAEHVLLTDSAGNEFQAPEERNICR